MNSNNNNTNTGITRFNIIDCDGIFIAGQRLKDIVQALALEDQFEQNEIIALQNILNYLNTTGLNQSWIVNNDNRNAVLKTAIDLINTRLLYFNGTALTENWILNNDNRNAVLKTAIDLINTRLTYIDTSTLSETSILDNNNRNSVLKTAIDNLSTNVGTNNGKLRYVSSTQGTNSPDTFSDFIVDVNDRTLNKVLLQTTNGANMIAMVTNTSTLQGQNDYPNNRILLNAPIGRIQMDCKNLQLQSPLIEIGSDFAIGGECEIRLGTKRANIKIGSHQTSDLNQPTIITIGNRSITQNTHTNLEGNIYTNEARFEDLNKSQALTVGALLSIITSSGLPLYINIFSALSLSSYVHSDLWSLAGSVVKNGDVETTNNIKVKSYSLYNTDVNLLDLFPVENTFIASGSSSKTLLLGSIKEQVFKNGSDITLRHNNILASNVNWALSEANDNVNALCIKGNDGILLHQGASSVGASMKILNSKSGKIELLMGNAGTQASCLTGLTVDWNSGQPQVICGTKSGLQNIQQTKSKLLIQQSDTAGDVGIEIVKNPVNSANEPLNRTTISDNNIDTHSLSLKTNFTGTTTKALYLDSVNNLKFDGNFVTPVKDVVGSQFITVNNNNGVYTIERNSDNLIGASLELYSNYTGATTRTLYLDSVNNLKFDGNFVTPVKDIIGGQNITVSNNNGIYTIAKSGGGGGGGVVEVGEDLIISATAVQLPRKSAWYGNKFIRYPIMNRSFFDIYMSANGKYLYFANRTTSNTASTLLYNTSYFNDGFIYETDGITTDINLQKLWISVCGTTEGSRVWAVGSNEIWTSEPTGGYNLWTQANPPPDFANAVPVQMRVNGDGKYQLMTDARSGSYANIYKSNDYGAGWSLVGITNFQVNPLLSRALGCVVSSSGKSQYVCVDGTNNNANSENGAGGIYSSQDYGATWSKILGVPNGQHDRVSCDSTGRYVVAIGSSLIFTSKNYGSSWKTFNFGQGRSVYVSHTGDYIWIGLNNNTIDNFIFSTDHGQTFTYGNNPQSGNYINMIPDCICCNNDGSIVFSGSIAGGYLNTFREFPNDVRQLQGSANISVQEAGQGLYQVNWIAPATTIRKHLAYNYYLTNGISTRSVNFNLGATYQLDNYRMKGKIHLSVDGDFDYPAIRFNDNGTFGDSSNQLNENTFNTIREFTSTLNGGPSLYLNNYISRDPIFAHLNNSTTASILLSFEIDLMRQVSPLEPILVCKGTATWGRKEPNNFATYRAVSDFERWSNQTSLSIISIHNWTNANSIKYATIDLEIIPIPAPTGI